MSVSRALALVVVLTACKGKEAADSGSASPALPPDIAHTALTGPLVEGEPVTVSATVTDDEGVQSVDLLFRTEGVDFWDSSAMELGEDGLYSTVVGPYAPGLEYYIRAKDVIGAEATFPVDGLAGPLSVEVLPATQGLPFIEDFEVSEGQTSLFTMDWGTPSLGFDYYAWALNSRDAASGASAAFHSRGASSSSAMDDWLISPPLDFSSLPTIQVTWQERGSAVETIEAHGLYLSTEGPDPSVHEYVAVDAELAAPSDEGWARSKVYDLSALQGAPQVWLAWRYEGTYADDWFIDDIRVEELAPDLTATASLVLPEGAEDASPGETIGVSWSLVNATDAVATNLTATMSLPEGGGTVDPATKDVDDIAGGGSGTVAFDVALDAELADNRYLPVALTVSDGEHDWSFTDSILIGQQSTGFIDLSFDVATTVEIMLGAGDPAMPSVELPVEIGVIADTSASYELDLTPWHSLLPPSAGENRWWLTVGSTSPGTVDRFDIIVDGETYGGTASAGPFDLDTTYTFYVPPPPLPQLLQVEPQEVGPGESGVPLEVWLQNQGAESVGPVSATLTSSDPDLTIYDAGPHVVDADVWTAGEAMIIDVWSFDVAPSRVDSRPLTATVELTDGADSWSVPISVAVPWPVIEVAAVEIRDDSRDGVLDPDETASIEFQLVNTGGLATDGRADVTLSVSSASTVSAELIDDSDTVATLLPGADGDVDFELAVEGGAVGQSLLLDLTVTDERTTYTSTVELVLGEPPWSRMSLSSDAVGDPEGEDFDFESGEYRVVDGELQLRLESAAPFDASTLFIESWAESPAAAWTYYRIVLNAGDATLQGYGSSGFTDIGDLSVDFESTTSLVFALSVDDLDLAEDSLSLGFGTGWCGPPSYYCDHYPDGWGYPYDSFSTAGWMELSW